MENDYDDQTEQIIDALKLEGLIAEASEVYRALRGGSSGTEVLMGVRWNLVQIDRANQPLNLVTRRKIQDLVAALNKALGDELP